MFAKELKNLSILSDKEIEKFIKYKANEKYFYLCRDFIFNIINILNIYIENDLYEKFIIQTTPQIKPLLKKIISLASNIGYKVEIPYLLNNCMCEMVNNGSELISCFEVESIQTVKPIFPILKENYINSVKNEILGGCQDER